MNREILQQTERVVTNRVHQVIHERLTLPWESPMERAHINARIYESGVEGATGEFDCILSLDAEDRERSAAYDEAAAAETMASGRSTLDPDELWVVGTALRYARRDHRLELATRWEAMLLSAELGLLDQSALNDLSQSCPRPGRQLIQ